MADLCSTNDVASALGLPDADAMSEGQKARAAALISQVSTLFVAEAQRPFAPGTSTHRLRVLNGTARLAEQPTVVSSVALDDGTAVTDYSVRGHEVVLNSFRTPWSSLYSFDALRTDTPDFVTVTYTHEAEVPPAVVGAVAGIVARYLKVDPAILGAGAGVVTDLSSGTYRARLADWTTANVALSREEVALARSYRYPSASAVIGT